MHDAVLKDIREWAKLADRIIVMDVGKVVDMGTHEELTARPGQYAKMWEAQAQWYERT